MIIACIGDSLTEGDYGVFGKRCIANVHKENYPYFLSQITGAEVHNYGKCGYRAGGYLNHYLAGNAPVNDADLVLVMLGTNGGQKLGEDTPDNAAYDELVQHLQKDAKGPVVLMTPLHATEDPAYSNCGYAPQVKDAVAFVRDYAAKHNIPMIDIAAVPDFCAANEAVYQANDGLHCVEEGYRRLAEIIADHLKMMGL